MIKRVLDERAEKARRANYKVQFAGNVFGEHLLINERGNQYKLTFRDLDNHTGYCTCRDYQTNKLGTCKHLMFAFNEWETEEGEQQNLLESAGEQGTNTPTRQERVQQLEELETVMQRGMEFLPGMFKMTTGK